jgi:hypothetical protein
MEQTQIVEAVGFAHRPGRNSWPNDIRRFLMRLFVWLLFRSKIPLGLRHAALFGVMRFSRSLFGSRALSIVGASKGDTFENDLMKLIFQATAIANIADNAASSPLTNLYFSLHTADPGETGTQTTSEVAYTSYARTAVARTSGGFTVTANSVSPVANVDFVAGTGGSGTATHFAVGTASSGTGKILYSGTVTPNIVCGSGVTPRLTTSTQISED